MILLSPVADPPDLVEIKCPDCLASVPVACITKVDTNKGSDGLIAGTLNAAQCPSCSTLVTSGTPVHIDMMELGLGCLRYAPLYMLEHDSVCEGLLEDSHYEHVFYSLDELARQVQARIRLQNFKPN